MSSKIINVEGETIDFDEVNNCNVRQLMQYDKESLVDYISIIRHDKKSMEEAWKQVITDHQEIQANLLETINLLSKEIADLRQRQETSAMGCGGLGHVEEAYVLNDVFKTEPQGPVVLDMLNIKVQQTFFGLKSNAWVRLTNNNLSVGVDTVN